MRIAIDASRITVARRTGTERYALELLRAMLPLTAPHSVTLYFRDPPSPDLLPAYANVQMRVIPWRRLWTHLRFAQAIFADRPDLTFVPAHTLPFWFPGRSVVTLHDLGYRWFPEAHPTLTRLYLDQTTRYSAWRAHTIIADSQATAHDLTRFYGVPNDRICVIYPGVKLPAEHSTPPQLPERYLLFIGTQQPRKNIARMVQAYDQSGVYRDHGVELLLGGARGWLYRPEWTAGIPGVRELGYVDDGQLTALYRGAIGFLFVTLYEGFGFPVIEAMLAGTPVITSNTSCLPELAGAAAITVDPTDVSAIADAIQQVVTDPARRSALIAAGSAQAQRFTWEATAQQTWEVLLRAAES
ncbi:MAG: glycosyltransferase family 4 protein [Anaerolineae bacterium]|jgi:glycosyltransferase involved in cell wall biosynthesis|nr:glycosyltransferase family 4 protein [Anaerolineae bacterium]